jgi:hypothetical protein
MRIVFLDIDGVLNSDLWDMTKTNKADDFPNDQFDPKAVALFNDLIKTIDAQIVLTSTWRLIYDIEQINTIFKQVGIHREVLDYTPNLNAGNGHLVRGNEVLRWCIDNKQNIKIPHLTYKDYLILDDNPDYLLSQADRFIRTDKRTGLTTQLVQEILKKFD